MGNVINVSLVTIDEKAMKRKFIRDSEIIIFDMLEFYKSDLEQVLKFNHKYFDASKEFEYRSERRSDDKDHKHYCLLRLEKFEKIKKKITKMIYKSILAKSDESSDSNSDELPVKLTSLSVFIDMAINSKDPLYIWFEDESGEILVKDKNTKNVINDDDYDLEKEDDEL